MSGSCTLFLTAAPLTRRAPDIAAALVTAGWEVVTVVTPNAAPWVDGPVAEGVRSATGHAPRADYLPPGTAPGPTGDGGLVVCPATFNTVGKAASGIADTYAHSVLAELLGGGTPTVMVPMVTTNMWAHPAWAGHTARLSEHGVRFLDPYTGEPGLVPMRVGSGGEIADGFDPGWLVSSLTELTELTELTGRAEPARA